jgi:2'-5' RNA ligase
MQTTSLADQPRQLRAFVALTPPPEWAAALNRIQTDLGSLPWGREFRWTNPAQIHLTLRFLGNIPTDQIQEARKQLEIACHGIAPFELELDGLGCFPNRRRPRIIWVGLGGNVPVLQSLQESVSAALRSFGDHKETKAFAPHLTVGRAKHTHGARQLPPDLGRPRAGPWRVSTIELMRSELRPDGARYSILWNEALRKDIPGTCGS